MNEEFKKEVNDLVELLNILARIKDKGRRKWLKAEIRHQLSILIKMAETVDSMDD